MFYCKECNKISRPQILDDGCTFCKAKENAFSMLHNNPRIAAVRSHIIDQILSDREEYLSDLALKDQKIFVAECDKAIRILLGKWNPNNDN